MRHKSLADKWAAGGRLSLSAFKSEPITSGRNAERKGEREGTRTLIVAVEIYL